jgi:hypothetical protein
MWREKPHHYHAADIGEARAALLKQEEEALREEGRNQSGPAYKKSPP